MIKRYEQFMLASNTIEGEPRTYPADVPAVEHVVDGCNDARDPTQEDLLILHAMLSKDRTLIYKGEWRKCNVTVGNQICPPWREVPALMDKYFEFWHSYGAWKAHNDFEKIHPFEDLNGRVGRLLWLWKMIREYGESTAFQLPFLHRYYYQTLTHM